MKCSLPKPVAKTIFQLDGPYAFLSLVKFYFIEVNVANHNSAAGSSQFPPPCSQAVYIPLHPTSMSIKWKFVGWTAPSTLHYLYIMDLLFGSSFILLDFFQLDLAVYPGIFLISPRLRLPAQEPFPSDPGVYSIVALVEKGGCSTIL